MTDIEKIIAKATGITPVNLIVTSSVASELLSRNANNRPLRKRRAMRYRVDMMDGTWRENGEAIKIDTEGHLIDGQHRCAAVVGTDLAVPMLAVFGVSPEAKMTLDQGAPRNAGDYLQMKGEPNAPIAARIVRLRCAYEANEREGLRDISKTTNAQVLSYFETHREDVLRSAEVAVNMREYSNPFVAATVLGFAHNVMHDIDADGANRFIEQVAKGEEIHEGDPAFAVRTRLLKMGKSGAAKKVEVLLTGWNAFHSGRPLKNIRVSGRLPPIGP